MKIWHGHRAALLLTLTGLVAAATLGPELISPHRGPVMAGPVAPLQPTPPFPTLIPTEPLPTLPPSVPTPAPYTPTATREPEATAVPTRIPPTPVPTRPSATPDLSPTPTSFLGLSDTIWLPFTALFHSFDPFDLATPEPFAGDRVPFR